ncbi:hypothetical protein GCM10017600_73440 [Streptosporangium carneum]|uniref:Uncharacterized protein n=1 Tax=Streptosporangium carneum TaxID=47481 RepID=A0A9W6MH85_9ACTN|nr:hypothetical protein GCM10017600_73440 [Streptosporangium carneum]
MSQKILSAHPPGATKSGSGYSGCDSDDSYAYAGSSYAFSGSFADVLSFYRAAAEKDGWQPVGEDTSPEINKKNYCFRKSIDATTAYFSVELLKKQEKGKDIKYDVAVSSSHEEAPADGGILC